MKILVTGAKGQLGYDICRELKKRGYTQVWGIDREELDLTDQAAVQKLVIDYHPDVIMHNAAWTAVDAAEKSPDACYNINVAATEYLAEVAERLQAKLVYISSDYVFGGQGEKYFEVDDPKKPLSIYGQTKYAGELAAAICRRHFIVRTSWVFGINGNNFVKTILRLAATKKEINVVNDQIGSPTYTPDLAKLLCDLIETEQYGVYHATNEGVCSWAEFAVAILQAAKITTLKVNAVTTETYQQLVPQQAVRPLNSRLSKASLDAAGLPRLSTWQDALARYIIELGREK